MKFDEVKSGQVKLNDDQINTLLERDIDTAITDVRSLFPNFDELDSARKIVLKDMAFNLGKTRLKNFEELRKSIKDKDLIKHIVKSNSKYFLQT